jgi:hypothetical protein
MSRLFKLSSILIALTMLMNCDKSDDKEIPINTALRYEVYDIDIPVFGGEMYYDSIELGMIKKGVRVTNPNWNYDQSVIDSILESINKEHGKLSYINDFGYNHRTNIIGQCYLKINGNKCSHDPSNHFILSVSIDNDNDTDENIELLNNYMNMSLDEIIRVLIDSKAFFASIYSRIADGNRLHILATSRVNEKWEGKVDVTMSGVSAIPVEYLNKRGPGTDNEYNDRVQLFYPRFEGRKYMINGVEYTSKLVTKKVSEINGYDNSDGIAYWSDGTGKLPLNNDTQLYPAVQVVSEKDTLFEGLLMATIEESYSDAYVFTNEGYTDVEFDLQTPGDTITAFRAWIQRDRHIFFRRIDFMINSDERKVQSIEIIPEELNGKPMSGRSKFVVYDF